MAELLQENWVFLALALAIGLLVAWWIFAANRTTKVEVSDKSEEEAGAKRNQSLIDAPPAAVTPSQPAPEPEPEPAAETVAVPEPAPAPKPAPAAATNAGAGAGAGAGADDLSQIKGLGPKLKAQLGEMGVTTFAQIAAWDDAEIDRVDSQLGRFQGRIRRDNWVEQAKLLATGDRTAYEAQFGRT